jgi:hypothetical protein
MGYIISQYEEEFFDVTTCGDSNIERVSSLKENEFPELTWVQFKKNLIAYIIREKREIFSRTKTFLNWFKNVVLHIETAPIAELLTVCLWAKKEDMRHKRKLLEVIFARERVDVRI